MIENNTSLKVVTWNIKGGAALGWNNKYKIKSEAVAKILEQKADFIILTEFVLANGLDYLFEKLMDNEYIWFTTSCTGKNGILIALKRNLVDDKNLIEQVYHNNIITSEFNGCNVLQVTFPLKNSKTLSVIGCRIETGNESNLQDQYDFERQCFDEVLIPKIRELSKSDICILCGDFNNAKHYGDFKKHLTK